MTALQWDQVGDRRYETGVDRGVLFLLDGRAVAWNGITGLEDATSSEAQPYYMDGVKFLERQLPGDFSATLKAFTYPDEFNEVLGIKEVHTGLSYHDQSPEKFHLCYRTLVGNDVDGDAHGYKIHILYNLIAVPSSKPFSSLGDTVAPIEFSWTLSGVPPLVSGSRPTVHISIDSRDTDPMRLQDLEEVLYGTETVNPSLPDISDLTSRFSGFDVLYITDNGDGTWTGTDSGDDYITQIDSTTFEIDRADVAFIDAVTYTISTTTPDD